MQAHCVALLLLKVVSVLHGHLSGFLRRFSGVGAKNIGADRIVFVSVVCRIASLLFFFFIAGSFREFETIFSMGKISVFITTEQSK